MTPPRPGHETRFFLVGILALWVFWFGLRLVVIVELQPRLRNANAERVLRSIPYVHHSQKRK